MFEHDQSILVVDDDRDLRTTVAQVLQDEGYQVAEAANGREALERLHTGPAPDLLLLDLMMPVMNGEQFRQEQRKEPELARIPVVVMTAAGSRVNDRIEAIKPAAVLQKPVGLDDLLGTIASVLDRPL
jgi:CheY-like chemotaxis protein